MDANGVRGDEPGFNRDDVAVYGLASEGGGGENLGQTQWGAYTGSIGWEPLDKNPWGTHFNLDDPNFQKTVAWYFGLADSVTRFAEDKDAAGKWVAYLGFSECQMKIADAGVVFPARSEAMERRIQARDASGLDVTAFTSHVKEATTQNPAVTMNAADVAALTSPGFEAVFIGQKDVSYLSEVNHQVNRLLSLTS